MSKTDVLLVWATVVGPVIGALIGGGIAWFVTARSDRARLKKAEQDARFGVARAIMGGRGTQAYTRAMNEAPLFFARDADVMRLWRELTYNKSMQRGEDEARLVLAIVRAVGFTSAELERDDVDHFFLYLGPPADQSGVAAARATPVEATAPADPP